MYIHVLDFYFNPTFVCVGFFDFQRFKQLYSTTYFVNQWTPLKVWQEDFCHRLRVRFSTHHSKCSLCIKHRLIIRKLGHNPVARRAQFEELQKHLGRQMQDRKQYYDSRAKSRSHAARSLGTLGVFEVCGILDSMDAAKYSWPKSATMAAKLFSKFHRPKMSCTTFLVHGHLCLTALTPSALTCNSSRTVEVVSHGLGLLFKKNVNLGNAFLHLQADNCSKECKNQALARHLAMLTALRRIKGCQMAFLQSGHSHEDVDALFSLLRSWIERKPEIWNPESYRACLQDFFDVPQHRAFEPLRSVVMLTRFRDWNPPFFISF